MFGVSHAMASAQALLDSHEVNGGDAEATERTAATDGAGSIG